MSTTPRVRGADVATTRSRYWADTRPAPRSRLRHVHIALLPHQHRACHVHIALVPALGECHLMHCGTEAEHGGILREVLLVQNQPMCLGNLGNIRICLINQ